VTKTSSDSSSAKGIRIIFIYSSWLFGKFGPMPPTAAERLE
jgi:hypothetical protein